MLTARDANAVFSGEMEMVGCKTHLFSENNDGDSGVFVYFLDNATRDVCKIHMAA